MCSARSLARSRPSYACGIFAGRGAWKLEAALSVTLAVLAALAVHSDNPWWAGISAFMVTRASLVVTLSRGPMRIVGSAVGGHRSDRPQLFVYQPLPFCLCLFPRGVHRIFGFASSRFSYAWLIGSVTANLVMLMAFTQPQTAFTIAVDRVADVVIGTAASLIVCGVMPAPDDSGTCCGTRPTQAAAAGILAPPLGRRVPRWLNGKRLLILHACRIALTVMLLPALANWLAPVARPRSGLRRSWSWRYRRRRSSKPAPA